MGRQRKEQNKPAWKFIDGHDSYEVEYRKWIRTPNIRGLLGIFELPRDKFKASTCEAMLQAVGKDHCKLLRYTTASERVEDTRNASAIGTGCAMAVRDQYDRVRPVVFVRQDVVLRSGSENSQKEQMESVVRLLVLLHELGHADDIANGVNFQHEKLLLDVAAAEAYAHRFVYRHAKRLNYRLALGYYLENLQDHAKSPDPPVRKAAETVLAELDSSEIQTLTKYQGFKDHAEIERAIKKAGRWEEVSGGWRKAKRGSEI